MGRDGEYCGNCNHSMKTNVLKLYCHLTDELVEIGDNCGMHDGGRQ